MPTYEYLCKSCGERLEVVQSFKDDALTVCPSCDGELRKVFSAAGIIFKGDGWHIKDYGDKKSGSSTTKAPASASDSGSSEGGSSSASAGSGSSSESSSKASTSTTTSTSSKD